MLGTLARWLRFAGFDTFYDPTLADEELADLAGREGRWLLTRDRPLASRSGPRCVLIRADQLLGQATELRMRLDLFVDPERFMSRCSRCNGALAEIDAGRVAARVPPFVAAHATRFSTCSRCGKIYWSGTHPERIAARLRELFLTPPSTRAQSPRPRPQDPK